MERSEREFILLRGKISVTLLAYTRDVIIILGMPLGFEKGEAVPGVQHQCTIRRMWAREGLS